MVAESTRSRRLRTVVLAVLAMVYVAWAARFIARSAVETGGGRYFCLFDDAMVSLRYAWNLAHGDGLVWNPGERVEGITSFLFTFTMAAGALLLGKSAAALCVQVTAIPLVLGVALLAHRLQRRLDATFLPGLLTAATVLVYYPLSFWSLMGMETGLLTALALGALLVAMRLGREPRGSKVLGLLLGLMFATRPDAVIPAAAILLVRALWILRGRPRLRALRAWLVEVAVFAGIVLGLTLFRWLYFGSPLPNTYQLKMANWPVYFRLRNGWRYVVPFLESSRYLILLALGSLALNRDGRRLLLVCFAGSIVVCQIWVGGDAWAYWRMLVPGVVVLVVLAVDGADGLARWMVGWVPGMRPRLLAPLLAAVLSTAGVAKALWDADAPFMDELRMKVPAYTVAVNHDRVEDGIALSRYVDPAGSVAVFAAGVVPYYSGLRGVDAFGKSDPFIARLPGLGFDDGRTVTPGHNKFDLHYSIETLRPDAIYDALAWARYEGPEIFEFVQRNYVQRGSFWLRRDSPYVHWDRVPER
jgi:arabinofuranosyltransferase